MKTKQWLFLLLALALVMGILCGCGKDNSTLRDNDNERPTTSTPNEEPIDPIEQPTKPTAPIEPDFPSQPSIKIDMSQINDANDFSEGLAFVKLNDITDKTFCINKNGEIVFTLDGNYNCGTFHNGIAFIYNSMQYGITEVCICDTEGNLTFPADLGATAFVTAPFSNTAQPYDCFFGDYILVSKTTSTFAGSTDELGILNWDLEYIVEPSVELYELYNNHYKTRSTKYYNGYLYQDDRYLNLHTGEEGYDLETMYQSLQLQYTSDMWYYQENLYKDSRDNSSQINLTQYSETLYRAGSFENGTAPLIFRSESASGYQYFFTILGEDGQFEFDPYTLSDEYSFVRENTTYLLWKKTNTREGYKLSLLLFDENGMLKQYETEFTGSYCFVSLADHVVQINAYDGGNFYYTQDFEPLF